MGEMKYVILSGIQSRCMHVMLIWKAGGEGRSSEGIQDPELLQVKMATLRQGKPKNADPTSEKLLTLFNVILTVSQAAKLERN